LIEAECYKWHYLTPQEEEGHIRILVNKVSAHIKSSLSHQHSQVESCSPYFVRASSKLIFASITPLQQCRLGNTERSFSETISATERTDQYKIWMGSVMED